MAVPSDGSYGIPKGLVFSFPCRVSGGQWSIVQGLQWSDFIKGKIEITRKVIYLYNRIIYFRHWKQ